MAGSGAGARTRPAPPRRAAARPPPAGGRCCRSPGAGCRICRGPAWLLARRQQLELDVDRDLELERLSAAGQIGVPDDAEVAPVDGGLEREADPLAAGDVGAEAGEAAAGLDGAGLALDLELAAEANRAVVGDVERGRAELQPRVVLGVEEVGRHQVSPEHLLGDVDAGDLDAALELRRLAAAQLRGEGGEAAAEGGDAVVVDREVDGRVHGVDDPGAGGYLLVDGLGAHVRLLSLVTVDR